MQYDAAIIGAGPAGCAAAWELARAGRTVVVLEKKKFPRPKVCGGCLSGLAVEQIQKLLGNGPLPGTVATQITFHIGSRSIRCNSHGQTRVILRSDLDLRLSKAAENCGAEFRFGHPAKIVRLGDHFQISAANQTVEARYILKASGLASAQSRYGFDLRSFGPPMIGRQWLSAAGAAGLGAGDVEMHWLRGGYIGLAASNADECIVAMALRTSHIECADSFVALKRLNPDNPVWSRIGPQPEIVGGVAGFPFVPAQLTISNIMLVGDAAGYSEPFSGTGIGLAMCSGRCAAQSILAGSDIASTYERLMRPHRRALWRTRLLSAALRSTVVGRLLGQTRPRMGNWLSEVVKQVHLRSSI